MAGEQIILEKPAQGASRAKRIKAVHLLHTIAYGGVETILINWYKKALSDPNLSISIVCFANSNGSEAAFLDAAGKHGIPVKTIPWSRRKPIYSSGKKLARILKEENADVLHTHNTYADLTGLVAAKLAGVPKVSSLYVWSDFGWKRNLLQWINQWALRSYDAVTAQCRTTLNETCARGIEPAKVRIMPSGFDLNRHPLTEEERAKQRAQYGAGPQDIVLVNAARLYPEKAQDKLLEVFKTLVVEDSRLKLWILGIGPLEAELHEKAKMLGLEDSVQFLGFCSDLHRVLKLADIQVHPSHAEGIPMSILSGMASALPIVASEVGGISEVLEHEKSALLVPSAGASGFDQAFKAAILKLVQDSKYRTGLGNNAAYFIDSEYSMEAAMRKLEQLYRDVLAV
jgi:glycosyltransferase involved in cell wall biosynthesis